KACSALRLKTCIVNPPAPGMPAPRARTHLNRSRVKQKASARRAHVGISDYAFVTAAKPGLRAHARGFASHLIAELFSSWHSACSLGLQEPRRSTPPHAREEAPHAVRRTRAPAFAVVLPAGGDRAQRQPGAGGSALHAGGAAPGAGDQR